jgi:hypothetical protein
MQLIEVSVIGVRSAVITLRRPETPMRFVLFPMLHLGTAAFYQDVTARLGRCQLVVAEGIQGRSLITRALTISYRLPGRRRRLGLVTQRIDYRNLGIQVITPDMTGHQLRAGWRTLPALQSIAILCVVPVVAAWIWLLGTRRMLSRYAAAEDLPGLAESAVRERYGTMTELLVDRRDELLVAALEQIHQRHCGEPIDVAVVYGAGHMPAVARYLLARYGYRPREAEWLTVFDL